LRRDNAGESICGDNTRKVRASELSAITGRLNTSEAALLLGFKEHDIALLIAAKLLVPLGKRAPNAPKYFAAVEIAERALDGEWLSGATKSLSKHWQRKNQRNQLKANCFA
jgi:hypothetical protein